MEASDYYQLKRDQPGANRFTQLGEYYHACLDRFIKTQSVVEMMSCEKIHRLQSKFMEALKKQIRNLSQIISLAEEMSVILEQFKQEYNMPNSRDMYVYACMKLLTFFQNEMILTEFQSLKEQKEKIFSFILLVMFIKLRGHQLLYDLFVGWSSYSSQVFYKPQQKMKVSEIPLSAKVNNTKRYYFPMLEQVTFTLATLVCVQPSVIIQLTRQQPGQEQQYQTISKIYKDALNPEIEQQDYFWHFVEIFFKRCSQYIDHTSLYMFSAFMEMSYFQLRQASKVKEQSDNDIIKLITDKDAFKYSELFEFVIQKYLPKLQNYAVNIKNNPKKDLSFIGMIIEDQDIGKSLSIEQANQVKQWSEVFEIFFKQIQKRIKLFQSLQMFRNEENDDDQQDNASSESKENVIVDNPFKFMKFA